MKNHIFYLTIALILCTIGLNDSSAQSAQNKIKFEVLSANVEVTVEGAGKRISWKDNENFKPVILKVKATFPEDIELFSTDFILSYYIKDEERWDRSLSQGISTAVSSPEDEGVFLIGKYSHVKCKKGIRYFKVFFALENDIDKITLMYSEPVVKDISVKR